MPPQKSKKETIICRCRDVTLEEVEDALDRGIDDPEELKRVLHVGMGSCQGRTCGQLVARILVERTRKPVSEISRTKQRPPLVSIPIRQILGMKDE